MTQLTPEDAHAHLMVALLTIGDWIEFNFTICFFYLRLHVTLEQFITIGLDSGLPQFACSDFVAHDCSRNKSGSLNERCFQ